MIVKRINSDKSVMIAGEIFEVTYAFNSDDKIDDALMIDDTFQLSDDSESDEFFQLVFGIKSSLIDVDVVRLDNNGNLFVGNLVEVWPSFDDQEIKDKVISDVTFSKDNSVGDLLESILGIQQTVSEVNVVRIDSNLNYLTPEIRESCEF